MIVAKFPDRSMRPPRGGWSYTIAGVLVQKHSESEILDELQRWNDNNQTGKTRAQLESELWGYYCRRQPDRCRVVGGSTTIEVPDGGNAVNPIPAGVSAPKTPEMQGPPIWTFLNTVAAQWSPGLHDYFLATCDAIVSILECPVCQYEWRQLLQRFPPANLSSRLAVCQWVNRVHNEVNVRKQKQQYPYTRMVAEFGAPAA